MFDANTDASTIVRQDLAYPVLTNELRLYIDSYNSIVTLQARMIGYAYGMYHNNNKNHALVPTFY